MINELLNKITLGDSLEILAGGGLVADFFSGSGTTAIACHNLGLPFICVEKDPEYYELSVQRLKDVQAQLRLF